METFETLQLQGLEPSILRNRLNLSPEALRRLMAKIEVQDNGCWKWKGATVKKGYGVFRASRTPPLRMQSHRLCYELVYGTIPAGLHIHHRTEDGCIGPPCVNPKHMLPITPAHHVRLAPTGIIAINEAKTECPAGHPYSLENTRFNASGHRRCLICERKRAIDYYWNKKGDPTRTDQRLGPKPKRTHCIRGHELTPENSYYQGTDRSCLTCRREYRKRKAEAPISPQNDLAHQNP